MLENPMHRRGALSAIIGIGAGAAVNAGLNLIDKPRVTAGLSESPNQCRSNIFEHNIAKYIETKRDNHNISRKTAQVESSPNSGISRKDFAKRELTASAVLPPILKELLYCIPFEESNYNTHAKSGAGAFGAWQFMPGTAANSTFVGPYILVGNGEDHRSEFELSTKAAVKYFEYIYSVLSKDPNYQILKSRYGLDDDGFLALTTVNAYNSGEGHMLRAYEVMANEPEARKVVDQCARQGCHGLYEYLTEIYSHQYKKWQKSKPYFASESSAYVYKILAYHRLDNKTAQKESAPAQASKPTIVSKISGVYRASIASILSLAGFTGATRLTEGELNSRNMMNRRNFLTAAGLAAGATVGALASNGIYQYKASSELRDRLKAALPADPQPAPKEDDPGKEKPDTSPLAILSEKNITANQTVLTLVYTHTQSGQFIKTHQDQKLAVRNVSQLASSKKFVENLFMGDAAYELYRSQSNSVYLQFAKYFYDKSLFLCQQQLSGKITPPPAKNKAEARAILQSRQNYLVSALKIIDAEFSEAGSQ